MVVAWAKAVRAVLVSVAPAVAVLLKDAADSAKVAVQAVAPAIAKVVVVRVPNVAMEIGTTRVASRGEAAIVVAVVLRAAPPRITATRKPNGICRVFPLMTTSRRALAWREVVFLSDSRPEVRL